MISDLHKAIFVHIPRTAGHSITNVFGNPELKVVKGITRHSIASDYKREFSHKWSQYYKFTFVRNPYDRLVSAWVKTYKHVVKGENPWLQHIDHTDKKTFKKIKGIFDQFVREQLPELSISFEHYKPQVDWLDKSIDYIGRYEQLENDLNIVCEAVGIKLDKIPYHSHTNKVDYRDYYSPATKKLVARIYAEDLERFNYTFEG